MNLNRLFPRLSIRAKLAIAFAGIAIVPVAFIAALGVRHTLRQAQDFAVTTLRHDVEVASAQTQHRLRGVESDLSFVTDYLLGSLLRRRWASEDAGEIESTAGLLRRKPLHVQMKAIGENGELLAIVDSTGIRDVSGRSDEGVFYGLRGASLEAGRHAILPVEIRDAANSSVSRPVIAVLEAVRDEQGEYRGTIVTEVDAAALFSSLDNASPNLTGVTGLVDANGLLLYHSERKSDWSELLATRADLDLGGEFEGTVADSILQTRGGPHVALSGNRVAVSVPLALLGEDISPLVVYRILPAQALAREARRFMQTTLFAGIAVVSIVVLLAVLGAHQITRPIYRLRAAAHQLASGGELETPLGIETRDEIEDLAGDFNLMANALMERRRGLETLVESRTRELGERSAELSGILQHSADAIVGLDAGGRVRLWNDGARDLFGYGEDEALGAHVDVLILPEGGRWQREVEFIVAEMEASGVLQNFQTLRQAREGLLVPVSLTQTAIRGDNGNLFGFSLIIRDTTLQTRLEEQMRRSERLAALSVLAGGLAHELGNPLAVIENRVECMQQELRDRGHGETFEADLDVLSQHANRLHGLIGDFLSFAREGEDQRAPIDLGAVVARVSSLLDRTFRAGRVALRVDTDELVPPVLGNEKAVETALINILLNALDATPPGGTVSVHLRRPTSADEVQITVADTGHGIPTDIQRQIFEPFFTTKEAGRGTGLGLAVCSSVLERHGGHIDVSSVPDEGATFTLRFPLTRMEVPWLAAESS